MKHTSIGAFAKRHRLALSLGGIVAACAVILPACGGGPGSGFGPGANVATTMTINVTSSPPTGPVLVGATRQYAIVVRDQNSVILTALTTATWSVVGTAGVATITPAGGLATCATAGTVTVHAVGPVNASGVNLTADASLQCDVFVSAPTTMTITVTSSPAIGTVLLGATRQYAIVVRDQSNAVLTAFTTAAWSIVGASGVATITPAGGLATCVAVGTVTVHAVGPVNGSGVNLTADASLQCVAPSPVATTMTIVVTSAPTTGPIPVGATRQHTIVVRDQFNAVLTAFTTAAWSIVGTSGIATITPTGGLATCGAPGTVTVRAVGPPNGSGTNLIASVELQCTAAPPVVTTVVVTPPSTNCLIGATVQFTAKAFDSSGTEVVGAVSRWLVDNSSVGTVSATGLVNCVDVGTTKVRAFAGSGATAPGGSADLTVSTSSTIASIHVSVFHAFLTYGAVSSNPSIQLSATAFNAGGVQIQNVMFVWGGTTTAASVSSSGLVTGLANGGALVTASAGGKTGTAAISVGNTGAILASLVTANGVAAEGAILTATAGAAGGSATGITSYSGRGYIPGLSAGTYTVTVALTGYVTQTFTGIVVTALNVALLPTQITMMQ